MKLMLKLLVIALCCVLCCSPFSFDVFALSVDSFSLSGPQITYLNNNISNPSNYYIYSGNSSNFTIAILDPNGSYSFSYDSIFSYTGSITEILVDGRINELFVTDRTFNYNSSSLYWLSFPNLNINFCDSVVYTGTLKACGLSLPNDIYYKVSRYVTDIDSVSSDKITSINTTIDVPLHSSTIDGGLQCNNWQTSSNGSTYCGAWSATRKPPYSSSTSPIISTPAYDVTAASNITYNSSVKYNYVVKAITEIYFPRKYSGWIDMTNLDGVASDNAIVIDGRIHFNEVSKITITESRSYIDQSLLIIPYSEKLIIDYDFSVFVPDVLEVNDSLGNQLLDTGNSSSQIVKNDLVDINNSLNSAVSQYDQAEKVFTDDFKVNVDAIDTNFSWGTQFLNSANFVRTTFNELVEPAPIYNMVLFSLILGFALFIIGRLR